MTEEQKFIRDRAEATGDVQVEIAAVWVWDEKPAAQWETDVEAVDAQDVIVGQKEVDMIAGRGALDLKLSILHDMTGQMIGMARQKYRHQPNKLVLLDNLTAVGDSRKAILAEALDLIPVWEKLDAAYAPVATNSLVLFKATQAQGVALAGELKKAEVAYREENEILDGMMLDLNDQCVAWYAEAIRVFKEGTVEGDLIRAEVPTTYDQLPAPKQAVITDQDAPAAGKLQFKVAARYAQDFDIYLQGPNDPAPVKVAGNIPGPLFEKTGLAPGQYAASATGRNTKGIGPMSEAIGILVS